MGPFGWAKTTTAGLEWRTSAELHGYRDCTSRFQLRHRATWTNPRFHSTHELDHIFIPESCLWHLKSARVLAEGPNVEWPWGDYTDHNPVEICLRQGRMWIPRSKITQPPDKPDIAKLRGNTDVATRLRTVWMQEVDAKLQQAQLQHYPGRRSRYILGTHMQHLQRSFTSTMWGTKAISRATLAP